MDERRIILLGMTGSGKSATGNTILQERHFKVEASPESVTKTCSMKVAGRLSVVDTPGLFNTSLTPDQLKSGVSLAAPGPHVFLLVIRLGRFTKEEKNIVKWIQENFGEDALLYTIVLFTHVDQLGERTLEDYLAESPVLRRVLNSCGNRYLAFNNNDSDPAQVEQLMRRIDEMVRINGGAYYTNEMYERAQSVGVAGVVTGVVALGIAGLVALALNKA